MKRSVSLLSLVVLGTLFAAPVARGQWVLMPGVPTGGVDGGEINCFGVSDTTLFVATVNDGFYRTTDYGKNWIAVDSLSNQEEIMSMAVIGSNIFAGANYDGVWRSTDSGTSWQRANKGLPSWARVWGLSHIGTKLYAALLGDSTYISADSAQSWKVAHGAPFVPQIVPNNMSDQYLLVSSDSGDIRSTDRGATWSKVALGALVHPSYLALLDTDLIAATDSGTYFSTDGGLTWFARSDGLPYDSADHRYVGFSGFAVTGSHAFVAAGAAGGIFLMNLTGTSWIPVGSSPLGQGLAICGDYLFTNSQGIWRRPLSDFGISSVAPQPAARSKALTAYPNPATHSATLRFTAPESGYATITIVNALGAEVARIYSGELPAGEHSFQWDSSRFVPGMYECVMRMAGSLRSVPIILEQ